MNTNWVGLWILAFAVLVPVTGCVVTIPVSTQQFMATQQAEAELAQGLARHLKTRDGVDPQGLAKTTSLYNNAVVANNAVVENLNIQLSQPGVTSLRAEAVDPLSRTAIAKLLDFREHAQQLANLVDISPTNPRAVIAPPTRAIPQTVATAILVAKEMYKWWLEENERQRNALKEHLKSYKMPQWIDVE